jgi:hypothetical protein
MASDPLGVPRSTDPVGGLLGHFPDENRRCRGQGVAELQADYVQA